VVGAAKFLVEATKDLFVVPNFVAVTKRFFSVQQYHCFIRAGHRKGFVISKLKRVFRVSALAVAVAVIAKDMQIAPGEC